MVSKILSVFLFILFVSCKKEEKKVPSFLMDSDRIVDIEISAKAKSALEDLSRILIKSEVLDEDGCIKEYNVGFYFNVTKNTKQLVIIQYFLKPCEDSEGNINRFSRKSIIPIDKINSVNIGNFDRVYTQEKKDYSQLFINMDYNANSIIEEFIESRGKKDARTYSSGTNKETSIMIEGPEVFCDKIKKDIEIIMHELKE